MKIKGTEPLINIRASAVKRLRKYLLLCILLLALVSGGFFFQKVVKAKGFDGIFDFLSTVISNYWQSRKADPKNVAITISEKDYKQLAGYREQALARGVIINDLDGGYVPATIDYNGKKMSVKLRLKGHMTDHLQNDKWSFRIKMKGKDSFMGMKRFSFQHPGTRGYIYEWIYHELMRREDIIALRYKFIDVSVNGHDWGIYAVEENFEKELLENNNRKKGPIVRFNPDLYWVSRYNEMKRTNSDDEFASYYSANPEAYREDEVLQDSLQKQYYLKAIALIEGLRQRKIRVSDAFDIPRLARFHAIIDLVGGQHSIDWSDIKYYYNPVTARLEPVAYESFTNFPVGDISANYKFEIPDSMDNYSDWHAMLFSDIVFFRAYIHELQRITEPAYLDQFFSKTNEQLQQNLRILYREFPYKKFEPQGYYHNQQMIRNILDPPKAIHAYFKSFDGDSCRLQVGCIESLPIEITAVRIDGVTSCPTAYIMAAKQKGHAVIYHEFLFKMPAEFKPGKNAADSVEIFSRIPGATKLMSSKVFSFPHTDQEHIADELRHKVSNIADFSFLSIDESSKLILFQPGVDVISNDLIIPAGYHVLAEGGVTIDLKNRSRIISYSPLIFQGDPDDPLHIFSSDHSGQGIEVISADGTSKFTNVIFSGFAPIHDDSWARKSAISIYEGKAEFRDCVFADAASVDVIGFIRCGFTVASCSFNHVINAINAEYSTGSIANSMIQHCDGGAISMLKSDITITNVVIEAAKRKAIRLKSGTVCQGHNITISNSQIAIAAENDVEAEIDSLKVSSCVYGILAYEPDKNAGHARVNIRSSVVQNVLLRERKSGITIDGSSAGTVIENIEAMLKAEKDDGK